MAHQIWNVRLQQRLAADLDEAARAYAEVAAGDGEYASCERCVFAVVGCSHRARRRRFVGHRRLTRGDADVMCVAIFKEGVGGGWSKYESCYETAQLHKPYAAMSEEAARDLVVRYLADVVVEFSRRVDGAFPASQPCASAAAASDPCLRLRH
jgi:hypothetical protein